MSEVFLISRSSCFRGERRDTNDYKFQVARSAVFAAELEKVMPKTPCDFPDINHFAINLVITHSYANGPLATMVSDDRSGWRSGTRFSADLDECIQR